MKERRMDEESRCSPSFFALTLSPWLFVGENKPQGTNWTTRSSRKAGFWRKAKSEKQRAIGKEVLMQCRTTQWILWAIAMVVFLVLALSGRTRDLGLAIAAVAVLWYVIVPALSSGRE
jgi:hypothetical protein